MKIFKIRKESFIYNSILIIISGFVIKGLGLINKIFITRLLGTSGMNLYILCFPTILLFISLSGFSLNIATSKLIAEAIKTKEYSPKKIVKESIRYGLKMSLLFELIFVFSLPFIINKLLLNNDLYYPLLMSTFLYPIIGITDTLRGTLTGLKQMKHVATVNIIEQIFRFSFSIVALIILKDHNPIISVSFTILALAIGEFSSLIYLIIKIRKIDLPNYNNTKNEKDAIKKIALPTTLSKLVGNLSYFFEPVLNTLILSFLGYNLTTINTNYTIINAYIIPLLTITSFLSGAIATAAIPSISESIAIKDNKQTNELINKAFFLSIIPGIIISIILFFYPKEFLYFFFRTTLGYEFIKKFVFIFLIHYIQAPGIAILQSLGKSKLLFGLSSFFNILRLLLIVLFPIISNFETYSLLYSVVITMSFETIIIWILICKFVSFNFNKKKIIEIILISIITFNIAILLASIDNLHFLLSSFILFLCYSTLIYKIKII